VRADTVAVNAFGVITGVTVTGAVSFVRGMSVFYLPP
jgi:hypothetical protein